MIRFLSFSLLFYASSIFGQHVPFDGDNCPGEWGEACLFDEIGEVPNGTADIDRVWINRSVDTIFIAIQRFVGGPGTATYGIFINTDCDATSGNQVFGGADLAFTFTWGAQPGTYTLFESIVGGIQQNPIGTVHTGDTNCSVPIDGDNDNEFVELYFLLSEIVVEPCGCGEISVTHVVTLNGGPMSSLRDSVRADKIFIINNPPVATINIIGQTCVGDTILFDGTNSDNDVGDSISYKWDFSYNPIEGFQCDFTDSIVEIVFDNKSNFIVGLQVEDSYGCVDITFVPIVVTQAPEAIASSQIDTCNFTALFTGSNSRDNCLSDNLFYLWSFGDGGVSFQANPAHIYPGCGSYQVTLTVFDPDASFGCNVDDTTFTITFDSTAPVLVFCPVDTIIDCSDDSAPTFLGTPSYFDNCTNTGNINITFEDDTVGFDGSCSGNTVGIITRTWTASDLCTNLNMDCIQIITVQDTSSPVLVIGTCPKDTSLICGSTIDTTILGSPQFIFDCESLQGYETIVTYRDDSTGFNNTCTNGVLGIITRTFFASSVCDNMDSSCIQIITILDTIAPIPAPGSCPQDTLLNCDANLDTSNLGFPIYFENCIGFGADSFNYVIVNDSIGFDGTCGNGLLGIITRTFYASDICGNVDSNCVQVISIQDTFPPVLVSGSCPNDTLIACGASILPNPGFPSYLDNCNILPPGFNLSFRDDSTGFDGSCNLANVVGLIVRTFYAEDFCGNVDSSCTQLITIIDTIPPMVVPGSCPMDTMVDCNTVTDTSNLGFPTFINECDQGIPNQLMITFTNDSSGFDGTCIGGVIGIITRTFTAEDLCGNINSCQQVITVQDTSSPVFIPSSCPTDTSIACGESIDTSLLGTPDFGYFCTATSLNPITVTFRDDSTGFDGSCSNGFLGTIERIFIATISCGNVDSSCIQTINIIDTIPPLIAPGSCPADTLIDCDISLDTSVLGVPIYSDFCEAYGGGPVEITFIDRLIGFGGPCINNIIGIVERTFYASDVCGNVDSSCIQLITLQDTVQVIITSCVTDTTLDCDASIDTVLLGVPTYFDNCLDISPTQVAITFRDDSTGFAGSCTTNVLGTITRTFFGTDACGNVDSSCVQTITIQDTIPPSVVIGSCPADTTLDCDAIIDTMLIGSPSYTDICAGLGVSSVTITFRDDSTGFDGSCTTNVLGTITRTFFGTDACGNVDSSCIQTITIQDTIPPSIVMGSCPVDTTLDCNAIQDTMLLGSPSYTDICAGLGVSSVTITFRDDSTGFAGSCTTDVLGTITRTFFGTDACGNVDSSCVQTITIQDTIPPSMVMGSCPVDTILDCDAVLNTMLIGSPSYTDICAGLGVSSVTITFRDDSTGFDGSCTTNVLGTITRTFFGTDACGNVDSSCIQTITIQDTIPPMIVMGSCPVDTTLDCDAILDTMLLGSPVYTDICAGLGVSSVTITFIDDSVGFAGSCTTNVLGVITRTFFGTDACGNVDSSCVQTITIQDTIPPMIVMGSCPVDTILDCDVVLDTMLIGSPSYTDICAGLGVSSVTITFRDDSTGFAGSCTTDVLGTITRTFFGTDACGNVDSSCVQTITIQDTIPPSIVMGSCPVDTTLDCDAILDTMLLGSPVYTDICEGLGVSSVTITFRDDSTGFAGSCTTNILGTITRTFFGSDACGNVDSSCVQTITIQDTIPPMIVMGSCPVDTILDCDAVLDTMFIGSPSYTDICSGLGISSVTITFRDDSTGFAGSCTTNVLGTITRTFFGTDACGNVDSSCVQTITIQDTIPPMLVMGSCPVDTTLDCDGMVDTMLIGSPSYTDICAGLGVSSVTITFRDDSTGFAGSCTTNVLGTITRTFFGADACGNVDSSCIQTITIQDTIPPSIVIGSCPVDTTLDCNAILDTMLLGSPSYTDICAGLGVSSVTITFRDDSTGFDGSCTTDVLGTITRTFFGTDACGNVDSSCVQTITIQDTIPPSIVMGSCPVDTTLDCDAILDTMLLGSPSYTDICAGLGVSSVTITFRDDSTGFDGSCTTNVLGVITRTFFGTDACGNVDSSCVQSITIQDTIPPSIVMGSCPVDTTLDCDAILDTMLLGSPVYTDICAGLGVSSVTITFRDDSTGFDGSCTTVVLGVITRTFFGTDACGNVDSSCVQTITIQDTIPPSIVMGSCPVDTTLDCDAILDTMLLGSPVYTDICAGLGVSSVTITFRDDSTGFDGSCTTNVLGTITRTFFGTDACGNVDSNCVQVILIQDTFPPVLVSGSCPNDTLIACGASILPNPGFPLYLDNCNILPPGFNLSFRDDSTGFDGSCNLANVVGLIVRTFYAEDFCGNVDSSCTQLITIIDTIPPMVVPGSCPMDTMVDCNTVTDTSNLGFPTFINECDQGIPNQLMITFTNDSSGFDGTCIGGVIGIITRTFTAEDLCGNINSCQQVITVQDTSSPVFIPSSCPTDTSIACGESIDTSLLGTPDFGYFCTATSLNPITVTFRDDSTGFDGSCSNGFLGTIERIFIATISCGNVDSSCIQTINIIDTIPPLIAPGSCPADTLIDCDISLDTSVLGVPIYSDFCEAYGGGPVEITFIDRLIGFGGPCINNIIGIVERTFYASDVCGNVDSSCIQLITLQDTVQVILTSCVTDTTLDCDASIDTVLLGVPTYFDNCLDISPTQVAITFRDDSTGFAGSCTTNVLGTITRTFFGTDACGNVDSSCVQTITIQDTIPPSVVIGSCPADTTLDCDAIIDTMLIGSPSYTDICAGLGVSSVTITFRDDSTGFDGSCTTDVLGVITRTFFVTDACGNVDSSCVQTITIQDTIPPSVAMGSCPVDTTIDCDGMIDTMLLGSPSYTDICAGLGVSSVTITFRDDSTGFDGSCTTDVLGTITRTFFGTDACGNVDSSCIQTITIQDTIPPSIVMGSCPVDTTLDCNAIQDTMLLGSPSYTDICAGLGVSSVTITFRDDSTGFAGSCTTDVLGTITRTFFGTDACGNVDSSCIQTITIQDTIPPSIVMGGCPVDTTLDCDVILDTMLLGSPSYTDICAGLGVSSVTITFRDDSTGFDGSCTTDVLGTITRTFFGTDACGNVDSSCIQAITIQDTIPPNVAMGSCPTDTTIDCDGMIDTMLLGSPNYTDICAGLGVSSVTITFRDDSTGFDSSCTTNVLGTITRTFFGTDACGSVDSSCIQTITIQDTIPPSIVMGSCPVDTTIDCDGMIDTMLIGSPSYTDICAGLGVSSVTITFRDDSTGFDGSCTTDVLGTITRTFFGTDACGNVDSSCIQTITIQDTISPSIVMGSCPVDTTLDCNAILDTMLLGSPSYTDICAGLGVSSVTITFRDDSTGFDSSCTTNVLGTITRTFFGTDACGSVDSSCIQTITIQDTIPPSIVMGSCPADTTIDCDGMIDTMLIGSPSYTDICAGLGVSSVTITFRDDSTGFDGSCTTNVLGTITRTFFGTDACGNVDSSCIQTITIQDTIPPSIVMGSCPVDTTLDCDAILDTMLLGSPVYTDICAGLGVSSVTITFIDDSVGFAGSCTSNVLGVITRTFFGTDACGNVDSSCVQTITIQDTIPPSMVMGSCPVDTILDCDAVLNTMLIGSPSYTDICAGLGVSSVTITFRDDSTGFDGSCTTNVLGTITRTFFGTDACGNVDSSCIQTITIQDTIPPMIVMGSCPVDTTLDCDAILDTMLLGSPVYTDICAGLGVSSVTITFIDDSVGFAGSCTTNVLGVITRTFFGTDACGNVDSSCVQTITIQDTIPPMIVMGSCPVDTILDCDAVLDTMLIGSPSYTDICAGLGVSSVTITFRDDSTGFAGSCTTDVLGTITRTFFGTDACGNVDSSCVQTITIQDTIPPSIVMGSCPVDTTLDCDAILDTMLLGSPVYRDICAGLGVGSVTITFRDDSTGFAGSCTTNVLGVITRTFFGTDACGNVDSSCIQTITIQDTIPPMIVMGSCPVDTILDCDAILDTMLLGSPAYTDICAGLGVSSVTITFRDDSTGFVGSCTTNVLGTITRTFFGTDACGNVDSSCVQTITIQDTIPPSIVMGSCPVDTILDCDAVLDTMFIGSPSYTDICAGLGVSSVTISFRDDSTGFAGSCTTNVLGTITRTFFGTDACGNVDSSCVQTITIQDTIPPSIVMGSCPVDTTLDCDAILDTMLLGSPVYTGICAGLGVSSVTITFRDDSTGFAGSCTTDVLGTITRTFFGTDACGNVDSSCVQTITIQDTIPPSIVMGSCPVDTTLDCDAILDTMLLGSPSYTDICAGLGVSSVTITFRDDSTGFDGSCTTNVLGVITRTFFGTDACGNVDSSCVQSITIQDTIPPSIVMGSCPADTTIDCDGMIDTMLLGSPSYMDICAGLGVSSVTITFRDDSTGFDGSCTTNVLGTITRIFFGTDACGNVDSSCVQTITIQDTIPPSIVMGSCPADITLDCDAMIDTMILGSPSYTDICAGLGVSSVTITFRDDSTGFDGSCTTDVLGMITRTFFGTDACGNVDSSCVQTVTIQDTIPPMIVMGSCPVDTILDCDAIIDTMLIGSPSYMDICAGLGVSSVTITFRDDSTGFDGSCTTDVLGVITRTFFGTDACGNVDSSCVQTITIQDTIPPMIVMGSCPVDTTLDCDAILDTMLLGSPVYTDICAGLGVSSVTITFRDDSVGFAGSCTTDVLGVITRTFFGTDACGNVDSSCVQTITIQDTIPPSVVMGSCPVDTTLDCGAILDTMLLGSPDYTDICTGLGVSSVTITFRDDSTGFDGSCTTNVLGTITRTFFGTDACGNVDSSCVQTITIRDTIPPIVVMGSCPVDTTLDCDAILDTMLLGSPDYTDMCTGLGVSSVTIAFRDDSTGFDGSCTTNVLGTITRTFFGTDACGNVDSSCVQTITIQDTIPPSVVMGSCPVDMTLDCDAVLDTMLIGSPSYTDICAGLGVSSITITFRDDSTGFDGSCTTDVLGVITRTFFGTDVCGNVDSSCIQMITIQDTIPPSLVMGSCPADTTLDCDAVLDTMLLGSPVYMDACVNLGVSSITITFRDDSTGFDGSCTTDVLGVITRTFFGTDACGNVDSSCVQTITIQDTIPPSVVMGSCPADMTLDCDAALDTMLLGSPDYMDACVNLGVSSITITFRDDSTGFDGSCTTNVLGMITRTFFGTDACGNVDSSCIQTITIQDTVTPSIVVGSCPADTTLDCDAVLDTMLLGRPDYMDACVNLGVSSITITFRDDSTGFDGSCTTDLLGVITRTFFGMDACGNVDSSCVQTITIQDTVPPMIVMGSCPVDTTLDCDAILDTMLLGSPVYTDICAGLGVSSVTITFRDDSVGFAGSCTTDVLGVITRTFFGTDACGNVDSSCVQTITIQDTIPPSIVMGSCPVDTTLDCGAILDTMLLGSPDYTDICTGLGVSSVTITFRDDSTGFDGSCTTNVLGTITRTFFGTDACGNVDSSCVQTITIRDTIPPIVVMGSCPVDTTLDCDAILDTMLLGSPDYTDMCTGLGVSSVTIAFRDDSTGFDGSCTTNVLGTITRTFFGTDACGNVDSSCVQTITIQDTIPPSVVMGSCPVDVIVNCLDNIDTSALGVPTYLDNCAIQLSGSILISFTDRFSLNPVCINGQIGFVERTFYAIDPCGNIDSSCIQIIEIVDNTPPALIQGTCPGDTILNCDSSVDILSLGLPQYVEDCTINGVNAFYIEIMDDSVGFDGSCDGNIIGTIIRTFTATDSCGNFNSTCIQTITIIDTTPPQIICPDSIMSFCNSRVTYHLEVLECNGYQLIQIDGSGLTSGDFFPAGNNYLQEWVAIDDCGNTDTCRFVVTIAGTPPSCQDELNISLNDICSLKLEPLDVLILNSACEGNFYTIVTDPYGDTIDYITDVHIGHKLIYSVIDRDTDYRCWGTVMIEDKYPPLLDCSNDTIKCFEGKPEIPIVYDNCGDKARVYVEEEKWIGFDCNDTSVILGYFERELVAIDWWNNMKRCSQRIYVERENLDSLRCLEDTVLSCCIELINPNSGLLVDPYQDDLFSKMHASGIRVPIPVVLNNQSLGLIDPPYFVNGTDTVYISDGFKFGCQISANYSDDVFIDCNNQYSIQRSWYIEDLCAYTDTFCIQQIKVVDTSGPEIKELSDTSYVVKVHDCLAEVIIVPPTVIKECNLSAAVLDSLSIQYMIFEENSLIEPIINGRISFNERTTQYLSIGKYLIRYIVKDDCGNTSMTSHFISVIDNRPPTTSCDEITQITLDEKHCSGVIYAKDLDDGSFDSCCDTLHYALAKMSDIEYWTQYWQDTLHKKYPYDYDHYKDSFDNWINLWIDCFLFSDTLVVENCGTENIVLRVYENCGLPAYDKHVFPGNVHQWYCWNKFDNYACHFRLNIDAYSNLQFADLCRWIAQETTCEDNILSASCCGYTEEEIEVWNDIAFNDPTWTILSNNRRDFKSLYSDCMIEVIKDDKQAPTIIVEEDKTVYCDGVPFTLSTSLLDGYSLEEYEYITPSHVKNICDLSGDSLSAQSNCINGWVNGIPGSRVCVNIPYNNALYGYYGGPNDIGYSAYDDNCSHFSELTSDEYSWKPMYCLIWLLLDQYDDNPEADQFSQPLISDNCTHKDSLIIIIEDLGDKNECKSGKITRTWTVMDKCGNSNSASQSILIYPRSDFEVLFPSDTIIYCDSLGVLSEMDYGIPIVSDDDCELVGRNFEDKIISTGENGCMKIERTWTLVDWCTHNINEKHSYPDVIVDDRLIAGQDRSCIYRHLKDNGDGIIKYLQIIKVLDTVKPTLQTQDELMACLPGNVCDTADLYLFLGNASDNCTNFINVSYHYEVKNLSNVVVLEGKGNIIKGKLASGSYLVQFTVYDLCQNLEQKIIPLHVIDCTPPIVYCKDALISVVMPSTGEVTLWAKDFSLNTSDNCTDIELLVFSFDESGNMPFRTFTCEDVSPNPIELNIWVSDLDGNSNLCIAKLFLQTNEPSPCDNSNDSKTQTDELGRDLKLSDMLIKDSLQRILEDNIQMSESIPSTIPGREESKVFQNFPNPFVTKTNIPFYSGENTNVELKIYDRLGNLVIEEKNFFKRGFHSFQINQDDIGFSGMYTYQLKIGSEIFVKKMLSIK